MFLRFTFLGLSTLENFKITLEQIIRTVKGQDNYGNRIFFLTFPIFSCGKMGKNVPNGKVFFQIEHFFLPIWKNISTTLQSKVGD